MSQDADDLLLVIDQFEEVVTLCGHRERAWLTEAVLLAAAAETSRVRIVLGIRAGFYSHAELSPDLVDARRHGYFHLGPFTAQQLREAITAPAVRDGYQVETALVTRIVADATGQPGILPLVSHALLETWRRRQGMALTLAGYEAAGGIEHAVAHTAENVYSTLGPSQQEAVRRLYLRMITVGEGTADTKRRISTDELDEDPSFARGRAPDRGEIAGRRPHGRRDDPRGAHLPTDVRRHLGPRHPAAGLRVQRRNARLAAVQQGRHARGHREPRPGGSVGPPGSASGRPSRDRERVAVRGIRRPEPRRHAAGVGRPGRQALPLGCRGSNPLGRADWARASRPAARVECRRRIAGVSEHRRDDSVVDSRHRPGCQSALPFPQPPQTPPNHNRNRPCVSDGRGVPSDSPHAPA